MTRGEGTGIGTGTGTENVGYLASLSYGVKPTEELSVG